MTCAKCLRELEAESAYCRHCGASVAAGGPSARRLTRRPSEGKLGGVCSGIAVYLDVDVTIVRLAWIILSIVPGVFVGGVLAYLAAWVLMPAATPGDVSVPVGRRLMRSASDRQIAGVCAGIAEYLDVDATLVRVITAILAIYPGALIGGLLVYLVAWFIIPASTMTLHSQSLSTPA